MKLTNIQSIGQVITSAVILFLALIFITPADISHAQIMTERLKADISYLCSPELGGRDVPGPTGDKTARWVADQFSRIGMEPCIEDSTGKAAFLQKVPLITGLLDTVNTRLILSWIGIYTIPPDITDSRISVYNSTNWKLEIPWGKGFYIFPRQLATVYTTLKTEPCNYGIASSRLLRNDYIDAEGRAALVLDGIGLLSPDYGGRFLHTAFKAAAAHRAGAEMLLVVYPDKEDKPWPPPEITDKIKSSSRLLVDLKGTPAGFPTVHLHDEFEIIAEKAVKEGISKSNDMGFKRSVEVELLVTFIDIGEAHGFNVVAKLDGDIPEYVVIGAHYDHLGLVQDAEAIEVTGTTRRYPEFYPGADDNASGVAGLLEICRRWCEREMTGCGLIVVAFTAEEDGMLGSRWFVDHLPVPRESIKAMINLDGIGRRGFATMRHVHRQDTVPDPRYGAAYFSAPSPELRDILCEAVLGVDLKLDIQPVNSFSYFGDAGPFHEAQIPTVSLFSGFHADYHSQGDTPDKIDYQKLSLMVELTDALLLNLMAGSSSISFDPEIKVEKPFIPY